MDPNIISIIAGAIALVVGLVLGKVIFAKNTKNQVAEAEKQAQIIIREAELRAENLKKEKELEAKEKFVQLRAAHEKEALQRNQKIVEGENRIKQREQSLNQKEGNLEKQVKDNDAVVRRLSLDIQRAHAPSAVDEARISFW